MRTSNRVDVVIADGPRTHTIEAIGELTPAPVDTVELAPDPAHRIIIVARTKTHGTAIAEAQGVDPVAIVTPRSPHAARSVTADSIHWSDDLTHEERAGLEPHVLPALATHQAGE